MLVFDASGSWGCSWPGAKRADRPGATVPSGTSCAPRSSTETATSANALTARVARSGHCRPTRWTTSGPRLVQVGQGQGQPRRPGQPAGRQPGMPPALDHAAEGLSPCGADWAGWLSDRGVSVFDVALALALIVPFALGWVACAPSTVGRPRHIASHRVSRRRARCCRRGGVGKK